MNFVMLHEFTINKANSFSTGLYLKQTDREGTHLWCFWCLNSRIALTLCCKLCLSERIETFRKKRKQVFERGNKVEIYFDLKDSVYTCF